MGWKDAPLVEGGAKKPKWASAPLVEQGQPQKPEGPPTLQERGSDVFGFKDYEYRGSLLPFARTKEGETEIAWPQLAVDLAQSVLLPGHAAKGGSYTAEDLAKFTLDYAAPATAKTRMAPTKKVPSRKELTKTAPTADELRTKATGVLAEAKAGDPIVKANRYERFLDETADSIIPKGYDEDLYPKVASALKVFDKKRGMEMDLDSLIIARKQLRPALGAMEKEERKMAIRVRDKLDDLVENLQPEDLAGGDAAQAGKKLAEFRKLWANSRKSDTITDAVGSASMAGSGFENGIRIEMRKLLRNPRRLRGFTKDEIAWMKEIEKGTTLQNTKRLLGKLSYVKRGGTNMLGGYLGSGAGVALGNSIAGPVGGYVGAAVPPIIGYGAQRLAEGTARKNVDLLRALAATGGRMPKQPASQQALARALARSAPPVIGAQIPPQTTEGPPYR